MSTIYDFVTVLIFVLLIGLFLHFSQRSDQQLGPYILPAIGCAGANYLGNEGFGFAAWILIAATVGYVYYYILRPGGISEDESL